MQRLNSVNPDNSHGRTRELLDNVRQAFGVVPNAVKVMSSSPAVLDSYLAFSAAMGKAQIGDTLHNQVKLNTSEANACDYCTSILCAVAPTAGLSADDILDGRAGASEDRRTDAALKFAESVLETRGKVSDAQLAELREAGFDDGEVVEIVASVVLGCFTNFLNNVADTELDVPLAEPIAAVAASSCDAGTCAAH